MRSAFRNDSGQPSERSDAGSAIVEEVIGFVKRKSGAQRREECRKREKGRGERTARPLPASAHSGPGARPALRRAAINSYCRLLTHRGSRVTMGSLSIAHPPCRCTWRLPAVSIVASALGTRTAKWHYEYFPFSL